MARMNSVAIGIPEPGRFVPEAELVHGEERDMAIAVGVDIVDSAVEPWERTVLSDHERLEIVLSTGEVWSSLNINGTTLRTDDLAGRDLGACVVSDDLLAAFKGVWGQSPPKFFSPLVVCSAVDESRMQTALQFWSGTTVSDLNKKARAFSPFLQGTNDLHTLLSFLNELLKAGAHPTVAAVETADQVDLDGYDWAPTHQLPCDWATGQRLSTRNKDQQRANLVLFFYYMAMVETACPDDFASALASAPERPTVTDIVTYIEDLLSGGDLRVFALQEVPPAVARILETVCDNHGYTAHIAHSVSSPGVVTLIRNDAVARIGEYIKFNGPGEQNSHRALATPVKLGDGTPAMVLNLHGDDCITGPKTALFAETCTGLEGGPKPAQVVIGDLQVGKVKGKHPAVVRDMERCLGVSKDELSCTPPLITRRFDEGPNVFCCQFKFKNI